MTPVQWLSECRHRLGALVRTHWGNNSGDMLGACVGEYLGAASELAALRVQVRQMSARLHELDPPPPVCRDFGVRFTGD